LVNHNRDYDIINVTFVKGDYATFSNSKVLFDMDYGQLVLSGNGAKVFVNSPNDDDETQFMVTTPHSSVIITGLTIEGFNIAIDNKGALNIVDSSFINNRVDYMKKNDYGGAIVNNKGASLTVYNTTFRDNYAKYGGAIYNVGTAKVIDCIFIDNKGYDNKNVNVDIYNHNASVSIICIGDSPNVIDHFPMAAWKQKVITAAILTGVTIFSAGAGFGISTAIASAAQLVGWAVGAGIGAIGGTVDAIIYSNDNQDYSQFFNRVKEGVVIGISAASLGMAIRSVINYEPLEGSLDNSLENDIQKFMYGERATLADLDAIKVKTSIQEPPEMVVDANSNVGDSFRFSDELSD
jgi:predicted outer membrane repeat protein